MHTAASPQQCCADGPLRSSPNRVDSVLQRAPVTRKRAGCKAKTALQILPDKLHNRHTGHCAAEKRLVVASGERRPRGAKRETRAEANGWHGPSERHAAVVSHGGTPRALPTVNTSNRHGIRLPRAFSPKMVKPENRPDPASPPPAGRPAEAPRSPRRRLTALVTFVLVAALVLAWWRPWARTGQPGAPASTATSGHHRGGPGRPGDMPQPVLVASAVRGDMPIVLSALGTVTPLAAVTVRTQLSGILQSVAFKEGQMVKEGDVLAQIDPRPYQISLENARGALAKNTALLQIAQLDLERYRTLLAQDSIERQKVDTQVSLVKQYEGQVRSDQASVNTSKLNLIYARITAPVSGRVGLRQVDAGNYVTPSDTNGIVVVTQLQPISVIFITSENNLPAIAKRMGAGVKLHTTAYDRSNTTPLASGYLETIDNQIDTSTGTIKLRALFDNKAQLLFPNQFVNARLLVDTLRNAVIVPSSAVLTGTSGQFVYVVKPDHTVSVRPVKVGPVDGERTSIASGLAPGERVVIDGSDRLREGAKITIPAGAASDASAAQSAQTAPAASDTAQSHLGARRHASAGAAAAQ